MISLVRRLSVLEELASKHHSTPYVLFVDDSAFGAIPDAAIPLVAVVSQGLGVKIYRFGTLQTD